MAGTAAAEAEVVDDGVVMAAGPGLELPTGGGEERVTTGLKVCPPRVFTMVGQEK